MDKLSSHIFQGFDYGDLELFLTVFTKQLKMEHRIIHVFITFFADDSVVYHTVSTPAELSIVCYLNHV